MKLLGRVIEVGEQLCKVEIACVVDGESNQEKYWFISRALMERIGAAEVGVTVSFDPGNIKETLKNLAVMR